MRPAALLTLPIALLLATGCESGTSEYLVIDVANPIATSYSVESPGLLRTSAGSDVVAVLCGKRLIEPAEISVDHGFGCLDEKGVEDTRTAWIEPIPDTWDAEQLCAMPAPDPVWSGLYVDTEVTGHDGFYVDDLATEPDPSWPQGEGTGTWRRDGSPCGGNLRVELAIR